MSNFASRFARTIPTDLSSDSNASSDAEGPGGQTESGSCDECRSQFSSPGSAGSEGLPPLNTCGPCLGEGATTDDVPEGNSNLYYLDSRVLSLLGTGPDTDTVLKRLTVQGDSTINGDLDVSGHIRCQSVTTLSDGRLKQNIRALDCESAVARLRPCLFEYRSQPERTHAGFIAQEVEEVMPHTVHQSEDGYKSISISEIVPYLVREVQMLRAEVAALKNGITG